MPDSFLILPPVKVHQCLFGYNDGHRMLASSLQLSDNESTKLLPLSDLAPNLDVSGIKGYWTGIPLASFKHYALMYTWPAPEMPRPGCVWTQVLLISFIDISRFADLHALSVAFSRPDRDSQFSYYTKPVTFDATILESTSTKNINSTDGIRVLRALYATRSKAILPFREETLDDVIFEVWSQQWPQLRRSFTFRTASNPFDTSSLEAEFDLRLNILPHNYTGPSDSIQQLKAETWEVVALNDLDPNQPKELRRFLWRYGSDIRRPKGAFRFLVELFSSTRSSTLAGAALHDTLLTLSKAFPTPSSAKVLKDDLVSCGFSKYSLLPTADTIDLLSFFVHQPDLPGLASPPPPVIDKLQQFWPSRANELLSLANHAVKFPSELGQQVLSRFANIVLPEDPLSATRKHPALRFYLIANNPLLLNSSELVHFSEIELVRLLDEIPIGQSLAGHILDRLLLLDSYSLAQAVFAKFPSLTLRKVAASVELSASRSHTTTAKSWIKLIPGAVLEFFRLGLLEQASTTKALAAFLDIFGVANPDLWKIGPLPWANTLSRINDNIVGYQQQKLYTFLVSVACANPLPGCEPLFEKAFEYIYEQLSYSKLPSDLIDLLLPYLPQQHWWNDWDLCQRLQLAIVKAYVISGLDTKSFQRLARNRHLMDQLFKTLSQTKRGRRFMRGIS